MALGMLSVYSLAAIDHENTFSLKKSLVFDQDFDQTSFRPLPKSLSTIVNEESQLNSSPAQSELLQIAQATETLPVKIAVRPAKSRVVVVSEILADILDETATLAHDTENTGHDDKITAHQLDTDSLENAAIVDEELPARGLKLVRPQSTDSFENIFTAAEQELIKLIDKHSLQSIKNSALAETASPQPIYLSRNFVISTPNNLVPLHSPTAKKPAPEKNIDTKPAQVDATQVSTRSLTQPQPRVGQSLVYLIDEESLMLGEPQAVAGATVKWIGQESSWATQSDRNGYAIAPLGSNSATRFVVEADGYLPALGYAIDSLTTPVVLIKSSKVPALVKSLSLEVRQNRILVIGKVIDEKLKPIPALTIEATIDAESKIFYSMGSFGLFHPKALKTGAQGDFLINSVKNGLQYIMPNASFDPKSGEAIEDWPAHLFDFSNIGPVATITMQKSPFIELQTHVVDGALLERPDSPAYLTVGGQRGVFLPNNDGVLKLPRLYQRPIVDLVEIKSFGYLTTWISAHASRAGFPSSISLFSRIRIEEIFGGQISTEQGPVLGLLRPEQYRSPVVIEIYDSSGKAYSGAEVLYFNDNNMPDSGLRSTHPLLQTFAVTKIPAGEWHLLARDSRSNKLVGSRVVRTAPQVITQVQF